MQKIERGGYTRQQIIDVLHMKRGSNVMRFRYDLLDKDEKRIGELSNIEGGQVKQAALNEIKRTATFNIVDDGTIDFLSDRIQPFVEVKMAADSWVEFPLGIFLLSSPKRKDKTGRVWRDVEAYDGLIVLRDDKFDTTVTIAAGAKYDTAIIDILTGAGIPRSKINIEAAAKTLPVDTVFEIGRSKLSAVNALLSQINYTPIRVDAYGFYISGGYLSPQFRAAEYVYADDAVSVLYPGMTEDLNTNDVPNKWIVVRTNAEQPPLQSVFVNTNPDSPTSYPRRGRYITDYLEVDNIADQPTLDAFTKRRAFDASQIYGKIEFDTAIMPFHDSNDVLQVNYSTMGINDKYIETEWAIPLKGGARMKHFARRVVDIEGAGA